MNKCGNCDYYEEEVKPYGWCNKHGCYEDEENCACDSFVRILGVDPALSGHDEVVEIKVEQVTEHTCDECHYSLEAECSHGLCPCREIIIKPWTMACKYFVKIGEEE